MQEFILIIISISIGFWQGLKKRNRKHRIEIKEYETKILELNSEIERLKRRVRLDQYNNGSLKKKNKERLETELTSFITTNDENYILTANAYTIINMTLKLNSKKDAAYLNKEIFIDQLRTDIETYLEESEMEGTNVDLLVEYSNGKKKLINPYDAYKDFNSWLDQFDMDIYSVTNQELISTMHLILYEMNFEKDK